MPARFRYKNWPLRTKIVALLVAASLVPLGIATWTSVGNARAEQFRHTEQLLRARAGMLAQRIDAFNGSYLRVASLLALAAPQALDQVRGTGPDSVRARTLAHSQLQFWTSIDPAIRGVALLDAAGSVVIGSEPDLEGADLGHLGFVRSALAGTAVVSDVFVAELADREAATIGYLAPVHATDGEIVGAAAIWVDAARIAELVRDVEGKAGPGSLALLVDNLGIRIAHPNPVALYRPMQELPADTVAALVAERRFGKNTAGYVGNVPGVSWEPAISFRDLPDAGMYRVRLPDGSWQRSVGERSGIGWMVFYMVPEQLLLGEIAAMVRSRLLFAGFIMVAALGAGLLFAAAILRPVGRLAAAARSIGDGDLDTRVAVDGRDELGRLGITFNAMAERIQQQAAALQRESADQYRKLFQTMSEGFCSIELVFDADGRPVDFIYLEANREFEVHSGLHDVVGKRMSEVVPDLEERWLHIYADVVRTGEPVDFEDEVPHAGRFYQVRAYRVGGPESRRVAVLFDEITERKLAQGRQRSQLESLSLLHQVTHAIGEREDLPSIFQVVLRALEEQLKVDFACLCLLHEQDGDLQVASVGERSHPLALQMSLPEGGHIGIDPNGLARCVQGQLVHEPDVREVPFAFPRRLAGAGLRSLVAAPLRVESRVFGVLVTARRAGGFSSGECEFLQQLSEHVALAAHHAQLYAELQTAYAELRETQQAALQQERLRALGQMASGIAHDINNAISPVTLYTDSLLEREPAITPQGRNQLETIRRAVNDVAATVARMREFYRARETQLPAAPVQLNELVSQVVELTRARWSTLPQQRGITIDLHTALHPDLPAVLGTEHEIRDALTNLVFNAVDAMPAGGTLTLRTGVDASGKVQVEVRDTGVGMDDDSRRRCLEPFFTTKGERGTGLGLAMVYGMARRHGAGIDIESAPGRGTCVRLGFDAAGAMPEPGQAAEPPVPRGLRILLVDDDPVLLRSLREILEQEGHTVLAAGGGQEGIEMARAALQEERKLSVVFTDLGMPRVDGRQVARAVKAMAPDLPVIMLTGWGERLASEGNVPAGVDLVLSKPPKLRRLREALAALAVAPA